MNMEQVGRWAFIGGLIVSVLAGFANLGQTGSIGLFVLGVIIGLINVTSKESHHFLLAAVSLLLVGWATATVWASVPTIAAMLQAFTVFVAGATLIVALREVVSMTASK